MSSAFRMCQAKASQEIDFRLTERTTIDCDTSSKFGRGVPRSTFVVFIIVLSYYLIVSVMSQWPATSLLSVEKNVQLTNR